LDFVWFGSLDVGLTLVLQDLIGFVWFGSLDVGLTLVLQDLIGLCLVWFFGCWIDFGSSGRWISIGFSRNKVFRSVLFV
jgi:hypothetical protein